MSDINKFTSLQYRSINYQPNNLMTHASEAYQSGTQMGLQA